MAQTGRLGCGGNGTGASSKYEGQTKPWHRPKRTEALGIAGHRVWMTAELDEGEMGGEEAQPPPAFQATGQTSQTGRGGHRRSGPAGPSRRGSWRHVGGGGTGPEGPGRLTPGLQQEFARPGSRGEQCRRKWGSWQETCLPLFAGSPLRTSGPRAGMGEVASEKETSGPQRAEGRAETGAAPGGPRQHSRLLCPSLLRLPFRSTASWRPRAPLPWCCLGCGPGAPEPGAGPAPHVGSRPSPPRGLQRARSPAGLAQGTSSRGDREGRVGTLGVRRASAAPSSNSKFFSPVLPAVSPLAAFVPAPRRQPLL